jgi:hypothetical protein
MRTYIRKLTNDPTAASEKRSAEFLMKKMNISKKELKGIRDMYNVSFSKIVELMELSKYEFVVKHKPEGVCEPCKIDSPKTYLTKFL